MMKTERYIEDYEDFEPEMRTWPFVLLSLLLPLVPLLLTVFLGEGFSPFLVLSFVIAVLPLFCTALSIRDGERAWTLVVSSAFYMAYVLIEWSFRKFGGKTGYPLSIPFVLALTPGILPLAAYTFFSKRKRSNWVGWALLTLLFSLFSFFVTWNETGNVVSVAYPVSAVLLSLMLFFVTRRTDSTPWYVTIPLVLLVFSSFTLYPGFCEKLLSRSSSELVSGLLGCFMYSFRFWYTLSFLFVFSALAGKSSYRKALVDDEESVKTAPAASYDDMEEIRVTPPPASSSSSSSGYTNPPEYSRFDPSFSRKTEKTGEKASETGSERMKETQKGDDKWYDFLEGGVKKDERERNRTREAYDDRGYDERERRDYPPRRRYDDERDYSRSRRDDSYYPPRRDRDYERDSYYRDDRRYDEDTRYRRDERERYDERERDYRRQSDRRYYDDGYDGYDDRNRR